MLIIGIGMGFAFQNCVIILQGSVPKESVPTATTSMSFLQNIGGVVGIAVSPPSLPLFSLTAKTEKRTYERKSKSENQAKIKGENREKIDE